MAVIKKIEFEIDHKFDPIRDRHYMNGDCTVVHCHHYATLYTQLALDATDFEGVRHLIGNSEEIFYDVLNKYYKEKNIVDITQRFYMRF